MDKEEAMETEVTEQVEAGWIKWKKCRQVLSNRNMPVKLKGKVYKTLIRPSMLRGAQTWVTVKQQETWIEVYETRMLRWMRRMMRNNTSEGQREWRRLPKLK